MLKMLVVGSVISVACLLSGRAHYSHLQLQTPFGSAVKVTPDPSNIWSFHETVRFPTAGTKRIPILVDFDNDGKMDTNLDRVRVYITDVTVSGADFFKPRIVDAKGERWRVTALPRQANHDPFFRDSFRTPLVLPVNSDLAIELDVLNGGRDICVHMIGRLVTL